MAFQRCEGSGSANKEFIIQTSGVNLNHTKIIRKVCKIP